MDFQKILGEITDEGKPGIVDEETVEVPVEPETTKEEKKGDESAPTQEGAEPKVEEPAASIPEEPVEPSPRESYRWAQMRQQLKEERAAREAYEKRLTELEQSTKIKSTESVEIPAEFVSMFGENADAWKNFSALTEKQAQRIVDAKIAEIERQAEKDEESKSHYQKIVQEEFEALGDSIGKDLSDPQSSERNAILKFAIENPITNSEGNIDLQKVYKIYKQLNPDKPISDERKKIAALTTDNAPRSEERKVVLFGQAKKFDLDSILNE